MYAHTAPYWIYAMRDTGVIPKAQELLKDDGVDEDFGYVSEEEISSVCFMPDNAEISAYIRTICIPKTMAARFHFHVDYKTHRPMKP